MSAYADVFFLSGSGSDLYPVIMIALEVRDDASDQSEMIVDTAIPADFYFIYLSNCSPTRQKH